MAVKSFTPAGFYPSANRGGLDDGRVFRMQNMIIRGELEGQPYIEVYGGSLDLSQTVATADLTGTITITANLTAVVGSGTAFTTQLHLGQYVLAHKTGAGNSVLMVVDSITDDTHFTACRPVETSLAAATATRLPVCFEVNKRIGAALRGNAIMFDNGNIFGAGDGTLTLDGSALPGSSLALSRTPQIAVLNAGSYSNFPLGTMITSGNVSAADTAPVSGVAITSATNANPVSLTSAAHGLTTGQSATISGATGAWAAINGTWVVTKTGANTFTIPVDSTSFGALAGAPVFATGIKNMTAGAYSVRVCAARQATGGYVNPGQKINATLTSGHILTLTLPAVDSVHGQDAWAIFVPLQQFIGTTGIQGPWFQLPTPHPFNLVTAQSSGNPDVPAAGGTYNVEYNDAEIGGSVTPQLFYNNDPPPQCEFIASLGNAPIYISCQGVTGTSPGPVIVPSNPNNIEAAPEELAYVTAGPEDIVGFISAQGRIYLLCVNTLQILQSTQTQDPLVPPFSIRPFWHSGFKNPYSLIFVDGFLIGWTNHGLAKSLADGDEGSEQFNFTVPMDEFFRTLNPGHVMLGLDPSNNAICVFHVGDSINASGFWTTRVWTYNLSSLQWTGDVTLSSTTQDMLVSGVANVNGRLVFLAGGWTNVNTVVVKTYQWDQVSSGQTVSYFLATQYSDGGDPERPVRVSRLKVFGQQAAGGIAGIYAAQPGSGIDVNDLVSGASGGASGVIGLSANSNVVAGTETYLNIPNLDVYATRVAGSWTGGVNVARDRIHRIIIESWVEGPRR